MSESADNMRNSTPKHDYEKSPSWFERAVNLDSGAGYLGLSRFYVNGIIVTADIAKAFSLCQKSAERGWVPAYGYLAWHYLTGQGVDENLVEVHKFLKKGADQKDPYAMYLLGACYESGAGVEKNLDTAKTWYRKAADLDQEEAIEALKRLGGALCLQK